MFRANTSIGLYRPPAPSYGGGGGSFVILSFGMMLLLMLTVAFFLLLLYMRRKKREKTRAERIRELEDGMDKKRQNIRDAAAGAGLNDEDVDDILDSIRTSCITFPIDGVCDPKYYTLKDGCCVLKPGIQPTKDSEQLKMLRRMGLEIGALMFMDIIVTSVIPRLAARVKNLLQPILAQVIKKTISAMLARFAIKAAIMTAKVLTKLASGPVGWALLIFDIISAVTDAADLRNYDSFIANDSLMSMRDVFVYKYNEMLKSAGEDYPMLFPFGEIFPEESEIVYAEILDYITFNYQSEFKQAGGDKLIEKVIISDVDNKEKPNDDEYRVVFDKWIVLVRTKDAKVIDKRMFEMLQQELPNDRKNDIFLVPSMSTSKPDGIGISISEEAAEKWNKKKEEEWFTYLDPFFPPNIPKADWSPSAMAVYTNKYLTLNKLNPGTQHDPRIMEETLPQKVTLAYPFAPLFVMCEKPRTSMKYKEPVNPREFGVKFNAASGVCEYTKAYCDRYVIDYKTKTWKDGTPYKDCKLSKDQYWAEVFLGTNVVRNAKRYWQDPSNIGRDLDMVYNTRKKEYGTTAAVGMSIVDPFGIVEGFVLNIDEKMAGKFKYCVTGDTCKYFKAKHNGGNIMTWSARDKDNQVYPNGMVGFQAQVKINEDHTFFVPEGGKFRVKCDPGRGKYFSYDELPDNGATRTFTCWGGYVDEKAETAIPKAIAEGFMTAGDFVKQGFSPEAVNKYINNSIDTAKDVVKVVSTPVKPLVEFVNNIPKEGENVLNKIGGGLSKVGKFLSSDRRLKKNIQPYKDFYIWEWNDTARTLYGLQGKDFGYITDTIDPKYVTKDSYGYEHIIIGSPVHKKLLKLKSRYKIKNGA